MEEGGAYSVCHTCPRSVQVRKTPTARPKNWERAADVGTEKRPNILYWHILCRLTPKTRATPLESRGGPMREYEARIRAMEEEAQILAEFIQVEGEKVEALAYYAKSVRAEEREAAEKAGQVSATQAGQ